MAFTEFDRCVSDNLNKILPKEGQVLSDVVGSLAHTYQPIKKGNNKYVAKSFYYYLFIILR